MKQASKIYKYRTWICGTQAAFLTLNMASVTLFLHISSDDKEKNVRNGT